MALWGYRGSKAPPDRAQTCARREGLDGRRLYKPFARYITEIIFLPLSVMTPFFFSAGIFCVICCAEKQIESLLWGQNSSSPIGEKTGVNRNLF